MKLSILKGNIPTVLKIISDLSVVIESHLRAEDKILYPVLMNINDQKITGICNQFKDSIGSLKEAFINYINKWNEETIKAQPNQFINESMKIINALIQRIKLEDTELFPLL